MKGIIILAENIKKHPVLAVVSFVALFAVIAALIATCAKSPEKIPSLSSQPVPAVEKRGLTGTWVSEKKPGQKFVFTETEVTYTEHEYSFILEGAGTYTLGLDGTVEWSIIWYSGNSTQWKGTLKGETMTVESVNSWDGSRDQDVLTRMKNAQ